MREKLCNGNNFNPILKNHKKSINRNFNVDIICSFKKEFDDVI